MGEIKDGGPAFPGEMRAVAYKVGHENCAQVVNSGIHTGMSLRDWLAGMALPEIMSWGGTHTAEKAAELAYKYADAMLKVREDK